MIRTESTMLNKPFLLKFKRKSDNDQPPYSVYDESLGLTICHVSNVKEFLTSSRWLLATQTTTKARRETNDTD